MKFKAPGLEPLSIGLTTGDTIVVTPEGNDVPVKFRKEALARGCTPVGIETDGESVVQAEPTREDLTHAAIERLLESDDDESFGKDGKPAVAALSKAAGFQVSASERDAAWAKFVESDPKLGGEAE